MILLGCFLFLLLHRGYRVNSSLKNFSFEENLYFFLDFLVFVVVRCSFVVILKGEMIFGFN